MVTESTYPITFRQTDAQALGDHLRHKSSVTLIGMKRVGISNFLRFFLHHPKVVDTYVKNGLPPLFVPVDLNDLVTRDLSPFWMLTLKRLADAIETSSLKETTKQLSRRYFSESIQLQDLFFTVDSVRKLISLVVSGGYYPTLFFIRFDRLIEAFTPEAFGNLQGIKDAANGQLSYIFTSHRPLHELAPEVFKRSSLSVFAQDMYLKPASDHDMLSILKTLEERYNVSLDKPVAQKLLELAGGHVQYLQLGLMRLRDNHVALDKLQSLLNQHEEINLQSEELSANLTKAEQAVLSKIATGSTVTAKDIKSHPYLWSTGMVTESNQLFSPLFTDYVASLGTPENPAAEFTKKEHSLFSFLKDHLNELVEREDIVETVWPEQQEFGVSDWAIDRLVARVRAKLKLQKSPHEIVTVITRGYKLVG